MDIVTLNIYSFDYHIATEFFWISSLNRIRTTLKWEINKITAKNPREKIHVPSREEIHQFSKRKEVEIDVLLLWFQ